MGMEVHTDISRLLEMLTASGNHYDIEKINNAYAYAAKMHEGQFRASGEPYISHPIAVAEIVAGLGLDTDSICAALLHDTVEDCADKTNLEEIRKRFGGEVALLVDGLTKLVDLNIEDKEEAHMESLRKMLLAMSKDVRVIFIKLCDRLHNMRTLDAKPEAKRRLTALETMHVYAPLAHRLGMQKIKSELENLSLQYLDPIGYAEISKHIESKYGMNIGFIDNIRKTVEEKLRENNIHFTLEGRIKSVYSIYKKMYNQNKSFDEIYDFYALRIIVDTEPECYMVLGIIHEMFYSMPGRFKDYISTPKPNMYRSLHTTVIGRDGIPFEVQIRTWEMHHIAEYGICAHWKYKGGSAGSKEEIDKKLEWIARLVEAEDGTRDPDEFMHTLKTDIFQDEVFVFTPKGDVISLPNGANAVDFAYAIHSAVGNKMIGAKVNGMIIPIDRPLQSGEIVEILTSQSSRGPSRDWLNIVKTSEARTKIRAWFKKEKRSDNIAVGKSAIEGELRKYMPRLTEAQKNEILAATAQRCGFAGAEDMYNTIGYGGMPIARIVFRMHEEADRVAGTKTLSAEENEASILQKTVKPHRTKANGGIVVDGEYGCAVKFAKCCNPLPGDDVIGFITKGFGISIHKRDCPNVTQNIDRPENSSRWVAAWWESDDGSSEKGEYEALLQLYTEDRIGLMADVATMLADMKVPIHQINTQRRTNGEGIINLKVGCKNTSTYQYIVDRLKTLPGIHDVVRGFS